MAGTAVGPTIFWSIRCQPGARRGELHYPVFPFLLFALCQHARRRVVVGIERADGLARVRLHRDGFGVSEEQRLWIEQPFTTTKQSMLGVALALAHRALGPGTGRVAVSNQGEGVEVLLESPIMPGSEA